MDLLSICNLSCVILSDGQYGYYIHGRSVHAFTETNMLGLAANLKAEQAVLLTASLVDCLG